MVTSAQPAPGRAESEFSDRLKPIRRPRAWGQASVSVVSAGVAYPAIRSPGDLVCALWKGARGLGGGVASYTVAELQEAAKLDPRECRKLDRFSLLALAAARAAFREARLDQSKMVECGVINGNMVAGWTFTEPQVRALHNEGVEAVSPYLATAWFPAAPQGQISIHLGLKGFAKTVTTDRCAGAQAIGLAFERISSGLGPSLLLAGGVEAPLTPFVQASLSQLSEQSPRLAEGAAYLLLAPGEGDMCEIIGHSTFIVPAGASATVERLREKLSRFLSGHEGSPPQIVLCNVREAAELEQRLSGCVQEVLGDPNAQLLFPTRVFGDSLAASGALAAVAASELLAASSGFNSVLVLSLGHQCGDLLLFSRSERRVA